MIFPNPLLHSKCISILNKSESNLFKVTCSIYSEETDLRIEKVEFIDSLVIDQSFSKNTLDRIMISVKISPEDAIELSTKNTDLRCDLEFRYVDQHYGKEFFNRDPIQYEYVAVWSTPEDLIKKYNLNELIKQQDRTADLDQHKSLQIPISLELFTKEDKELKDKSVSFCARDASIKDIVNTVISCFEIENVDMVEPENPNIYDNITVCNKTFLNVFDYLQDSNKYGIYSRGLAYYHTGKTLYVYPNSKTDIESDNIINLYNVSENSYAGCHGYHVADGDTVDIVLNGNVHIEDRGEISSENLGTYVVTTHSDKMLDNNRVGTENNGTLRDDNLVVLNLDNANKTSISSNKVRYVDPTNNLFKLASEISKENYTLVIATWNAAMPHVIKPGSRVVYNYEIDDGMASTVGVLDSVIYSMAPIARPGKIIYGFKAILTMRLLQVKSQEQITSDLQAQQDADMFASVPGGIASVL